MSKNTGRRVIAEVSFDETAQQYNIGNLKGFEILEVFRREAERFASLGKFYKEEQHKKASRIEVEPWESICVDSDVAEHYNEYNDLIKFYNTYRKLIDFKLQLIIIGNKVIYLQRQFFGSGMSDHFLISKISLEQISDGLPYSPSTVERRVKELYFRMNGIEFSARDLVTSSRDTFLTKKVLELKRDFPNAGAPKIASILNQSGTDVCQRSIGLILNNVNQFV